MLLKIDDPVLFDGFGFCCGAVFLLERKLLLSRSSSSSKSDFFWVADVDGLLTTGLLLLKVSSLSSSSLLNNDPVLDWLVCKGCFEAVVEVAFIFGKPKGPPKGWFDLVGSFGKNGAFYPPKERGFFLAFNYYCLTLYYYYYLSLIY